MLLLLLHRWWAGVREEAAEEGGVRYAATPAASPSYYGLRLLHSFLHPDLVLRLDRGECRASATSGGSRSYALVPADELSRALARSVGVTPHPRLLLVFVLCNNLDAIMLEGENLKWWCNRMSWLVGRFSSSSNAVIMVTRESHALTILNSDQVLTLLT